MGTRNNKRNRNGFSYLETRLEELYKERDRDLFKDSGLPEPWVDSYKRNLDFEIISIEDYLSIKRKNKQLKKFAYILLTALIAGLLLLLLL